MSDSAYLEPARSIIARLGGIDAVAQETKVHHTRVRRWTYPAERGGTGGRIPQRHIPTLMELAHKNGKRLRHADFYAA